MAMTNSRELPAPPRLIPALVEGFDAITNHILLILFPVALDLLIWFAPHLRLKNLIETILMEMTLFTANEGPELASMVEAGREVWLQMAEQINLASALRSYPVGIPSLMSSSLPLETPLGVPWMLEISSIGYAFLITVVLIGIGLIMGTLYYLMVAQSVLDGDIQWKTIFYEWPRSSFEYYFAGFGLDRFVFSCKHPR